MLPKTEITSAKGVSKFLVAGIFGDKSAFIFNSCCQEKSITSANEIQDVKSIFIALSLTKLVSFDSC